MTATPAEALPEPLDLIAVGAERPSNIAVVVGQRDGPLAAFLVGAAADRAPAILYRDGQPVEP